MKVDYTIGEIKDIIISTITVGNRYVITNDDACKTIKVLNDSYIDLINEQGKLLNRIYDAINKIQYIIDYGIDYDGFNTVESLKGLIDMLVDYAREARKILYYGSDKNEF